MKSSFFKNLGPISLATIKKHLECNSFKIDEDTDFKEFSSIKVEDEITIRVIGIRFELNDNYISVIAEFVAPRKVKKRPKIIISTKKNA